VKVLIDVCLSDYLNLCYCFYSHELLVLAERALYQTSSSVQLQVQWIGLFVMSAFCLIVPNPNQSQKAKDV